MLDPARDHNRTPRFEDHVRSRASLSRTAEALRYNNRDGDLLEMATFEDRCILTKPLSTSMISREGGKCSSLTSHLLG